jgi:ABC-type amino acid transport substrate-binding protein
MVMGYRTSARLPFIAEQPSKQGMYFTLYQQALESIGCTLTVRRAPKKRILKLIATGEVNFYPGLGFSSEREQYLHFIENGFMSNVIALSHKDIADIHSLTEMKGKVLLSAIGGQPFDAIRYGVYLRQAHDLSITTAIKLLENRRVDFYLYNEANIRYYLKLHPNNNIKAHPCCSTPSPMFLGFSKRSQYAQAISNPDFSLLHPISASNPQQLLSPTSKAYAFKIALQELKSSGVIEKLEAFYYQ